MPATGEESAQGEYTLVEGYLELRQSSGKRQSESAKSPRGWEGLHAVLDRHSMRSTCGAVRQCPGRLGLAPLLRASAPRRTALQQDSGDNEARAQVITCSNRYRHVTHQAGRISGPPLFMLTVSAYLRLSSMPLSPRHHSPT